MKLKFAIIILCLFILPFGSAYSAKNSSVWKELQSGLSYATFSFSAVGIESETTIHAFQVDPKKLKIAVATSQSATDGTTAEDFAKTNKALLAINGGFFTPEHKPIGLVIKNGKQINPIHRTSWWGIFTLSNDTPQIVAPKEFNQTNNIQTALQVGPRLVINGSVPKLKDGVAARSGLGITPDNKVIIVITQGPGITLSEFAKIFGSPAQNGGLGCKNALALDGGSSSQLYAKAKKLKLSISGIAKVPNGIVVLQK